VGVYDTCWCSGGVLSLGRARAYTIWILTPTDIAALWYPIVGGTVLSRFVLKMQNSAWRTDHRRRDSVSVAIFLIFTNILLDPQSAS
jgi:hypothetical protein